MENTYFQNVRVLIVDDQDFIRSLIRQILGVLGCKHITEAKNGGIAWGLMLNSPPDLLIVDWEMQPMDGIELVKKVCNDPHSPDLFMPIIMLTAHSERPRIIAARDSGVNEFVMKPISAKTFFSRLNAIIEYPRRFVRTGEYFGPDRRHKKVFVDFERRDTKKKEEVIDTHAADQQKSQGEVNATLISDGEDSEAVQVEPENKG